MRILALVPVLNEATTIEPLVRGVFATGAVDGVLVLDDGSTDGTWERLEALREEHRALDLVRRNERGLGTALQTGFRVALDRYDFDRLVTLDADLSHDPAEIPRLLAVPADVVLGSRYCPGGAIRAWSLARRLISFGANRVARHLVGLPAQDVTTGYRVYSRAIVTSIAREAACGGYEFQIEALTIAQAHGASIAEYPIEFVERGAGRSKLATRDEAARFARFVAVATVRRLVARRARARPSDA